jgi:hypothetical protein
MIKSQRKLNCQLLSDGHNDIISLDDKVTTPGDIFTISDEINLYYIY